MWTFSRCWQFGHSPLEALDSSRSRARRGLNGRTFPTQRSYEALLTLALDLCQSAQAHSRQPDEAGRVRLVVSARFFEACDLRIIQGARRFATRDGDAALEQLEARDAIDVALRIVDQRLQRLALGREPVAVVDHLRIARDERVAKMQHLAIEGELLDRAMAVEQHRHAGRLVHAARFDADIAILHQVDAPDAVAPRDLISALDDGRRSEPLAIDRDRIALRIFDLDILGLVRRILRRNGQAEHILIGLAPRILEDAALVADVHKVAIHRVGFLRRDSQRNFLLVRVCDHVGAAFERPRSKPPWCYDLQLGGQPREGQFEAHLVVALAGAPMPHCVGTLSACDLSQLLGDDGARDRGAEQVVAFVYGVGAHDRENEIARELLAQVYKV